MALQKVKDSMRTTTALDATKLAGNLPALSGSSLTGITHTPADNSVTLAKLASGTDGNIITYDASGDPVAVATGTAGQVLTSAGAGAPPTFAAAGGGANTFIGRWTLAFDSIGSGSGNWTDFTFQTCGFEPSVIIVLATVENDAYSASWMFYGYGARDGSTNSVWEAKGIKHSSSDVMNVQDTALVQYNGASTASRNWRLKSVSSTGFQMETYYQGSTADNCYYNWLAIG